MLAALTDNVRKDKNDFVLFNGDMVTTFASGQQIFDGFLTTAVKSFASEIPFFYARGNHETRGLFFAHYRDYFPSPTGQTYYSFQAGPVFFIVLDGGEDKPDSDIEYNGLGGFDTYRAQEAEWLKAVSYTHLFSRHRSPHVVQPRPDGEPPAGRIHGRLRLPAPRAGIDGYYDRYCRRITT